MGARFYAPDLGIWTAGDPVHFTDPERLASSDFTSTNPYAYANQNPIIGVDEDGEWMHIAAGAFFGGVIGGGLEAVRQYRAEGKISDWGKVGGAAAGGAVSGALTAAVPGSGVLGVAATNGMGSAAGGVVDRAVASGGKDLGTLADIKRDATVGAVMGVGGKYAGKAVSQVKAKPSVPAAPKPSVSTPKPSGVAGGTPKALPAPKARGNPNPIGERGTFYVDPKGNVIPTPLGGRIQGSPDGRFIQVKDAAGNPTGVRIDGPHNPAGHSDPRALAPHGHVPGVTNPDGTPWLPIK